MKFKIFSSLWLHALLPILLPTDLFLKSILHPTSATPCSQIYPPLLHLRSCFFLRKNPNSYLNPILTCQNSTCTITPNLHVPPSRSIHLDKSMRSVLSTESSHVVHFALFYRCFCTFTLSPLLDNKFSKGRNSILISLLFLHA